MAGHVKLTSVADRRDLRDFLALTGRIYGRDPRHIPPLRAQHARRAQQPGRGRAVPRDGRLLHGYTFYEKDL